MAGLRVEAPKFLSRFVFFLYLWSPVKTRLKPGPDLHPPFLGEFLVFPAGADGEDMGQRAQQREGDLD